MTKCISLSNERAVSSCRWLSSTRGVLTVSFKVWTDARSWPLTAFQHSLSSTVHSDEVWPLLRLCHTFLTSLFQTLPLQSPSPIGCLGPKILNKENCSPWRDGAWFSIPVMSKGLSLFVVLCVHLESNYINATCNYCSHYCGCTPCLTNVDATVESYTSSFQRSDDKSELACRPVACPICERTIKFVFKWQTCLKVQAFEEMCGQIHWQNKSWKTFKGKFHAEKSKGKMLRIYFHNSPWCTNIDHFFLKEMLYVSASSLWSACKM